MKRVVLSFVFACIALVAAVLRPELVSMSNVQWVIIIGLALVIISLIFDPITEHITVEKWQTYELKPPNSLRYGINVFRNQPARFVLTDGSVIIGTLVGRSDGLGTFTFEVSEGVYETIAQASLLKIETEGVKNTPEDLLEWNDTSPLIIPRSCS